MTLTLRKKGVRKYGQNQPIAQSQPNRRNFIKLISLEAKTRDQHNQSRSEELTKQFFHIVEIFLHSKINEIIIMSKLDF